MLVPMMLRKQRIQIIQKNNHNQSKFIISMKKALFLVALMAVGTASFAQKSALTKAKTLIQEASMDSRNIKYDKLEEAWTLLQGCMQDPVTSVLGDTYSNAARVQTFYMSKMLNERAANNGQMDMDKFFDNQMQIVDLYSKANKWDNTPNAKGKFVLKDEERQKNHNFYQQVAGGPRSNLIIAASNLVNSDPNRCLKFLDQFFGTFDDPLFAEASSAALDSAKLDAYYIQATAMKANAKTAEDTTALIPVLEKSMKSANYGVMACSDLMTIYKSRGQMDKWMQICDEGMAMDPTQKFFPKVKLEQLVNNKKYDEAMKLCDLLNERFPDDDYALYTKGVINFTQEKYADAVTIFKQAAEVTGTNAEAWSSAGTCTWKIAMDNRAKVDVCTKYINEAIGYFKKAEELAPDQPRLWGYFLYQAYTSLKKPAEAAKYKQYKDM